MDRTEQKVGPIWLAWAGWRMRVPATWRPLRIEGGLRQGSMMIGDAESAVAQVKWSRPGRTDFDPRQWLRQRLGQAQSQRAGHYSPPEGFSVAAWAPNSRSGRGPARSLFCGYSPRAGLLVEIVVQTEGRRDLDTRMVDQVLPSLRADPADGPVRWAVFEASFIAPGGFDVRDRKFQPGHMCLLLGSGRERLLLRQIYPAAMALAKKDIIAWLRSGPFPERRKFWPTGESADWSVDSSGRRLAGQIRRGVKRLPAPLGWLCPRWTVAAGAVDADLDRLLLAEHDSPKLADETIVCDAIGSMNWASLRPREGS